MKELVDANIRQREQMAAQAATQGRTDQAPPGQDPAQAAAGALPAAQGTMPDPAAQQLTVAQPAVA